MKFRCLASGNVLEFFGYDIELMKKNHSYTPVADDAVSEPLKKNVIPNVQSGLPRLQKNKIQRVSADGTDIEEIDQGPLRN